MNETSSTYRSPWLVSFTDGTPPDDLDDGLHWFPVGPTGDGRVMWRRPRSVPARPYQLRGHLRAYLRRFNMDELRKLGLGSLENYLVDIKEDTAERYIERVVDCSGSICFVRELLCRLADARRDDRLALDGLWELAVSAHLAP